MLQWPVSDANISGGRVLEMGLLHHRVHALKILTDAVKLSAKKG